MLLLNRKQLNQLSFHFITLMHVMNSKIYKIQLESIICVFFNNFGQKDFERYRNKLTSARPGDSLFNGLQLCISSRSSCTYRNKFLQHFFNSCRFHLRISVSRVIGVMQSRSYIKRQHNTQTFCTVSTQYLSKYTCLLRSS